MKNMPFLRELVEARLYKGASTLKGKTAKEIGSIVFLMIMALEILRHEDFSYAKKYVDGSLQFGEFSAMRSSMSDFGNLVAVLSNQEDYDGYISTDYGVNIPFLQLKRYLNDLRYQHSGSKSADQTFFLRLEDYLKVSDSILKTIRRYVSHWDTLADGEKRSVIENMKREFNTRSNYNDIYLHLKQGHFSFQA